MSDMENEAPKFTTRKEMGLTENEEMPPPPEWRTAFVVVMDGSGRVFVDNNSGVFAHKIHHVAGHGEAALMLGLALEEFRVEQVKSAVLEAVKVELIRAARASDGAPMERQVAPR